MAAWTEVDLSVPGSDEVGTLSKGLRDFLTGLTAINTNAIFPVLRALALVQERQDAAALTAKALIDAVRDILDDFTKDSIGYALVVPVLKPFARAVGPPDVFLEELEQLSVMQVLRNPKEELIGLGGNYGLYCKIVESIYDRADFSRPDFGKDSYVSGAMFVFGSDTYLNTIKGLRQLQGIFGGSIPLPLDGFSVPVPQNLKARPISVSNRQTLSSVSVVSAEVLPVLGPPQTTVPFDVHVRWDPEPSVKRLPAFGRYRMQVESWTLYIKRDEQILSGEDLSQYALQTREIVAASSPVAGQVFSATAYQAIVSKLDPTGVYWISAAYTVRVTDEETEETILMEPVYASLSTQRRVCIQEQTPVTKFMDGEPPDWMAITSPLAPFPQVRQVFAEAQLALDVIEAGLVNIDNEITTSVDFLEENLVELAALIDRIAATSSNLTAAFAGVDIGVYATTFQGRGGAPYFVDTMGQLLLDPSTSNRPPFDEGDEAVGALVLLNVSDTLAGGADFVALLGGLLGSSTTGFVVTDIDKVPPPATDSLLDTTSSSSVTAIKDLGVADDDPC